MNNDIKQIPENIRIAAIELALDVEPIYALLNWKWYDVGIPVWLNIYHELLDLYTQLIEDDAEWVKSGGLMVSWREEDGKPIYTLSFGLEREIEA